MMPTERSLKKSSKERLSLRRARDAERGFSHQRSRSSEGGESILPPDVRSRLWKLFGQIEHELEGMYAENVACKLTWVGQSLFYNLISCGFLNPWHMYTLSYSENDRDVTERVQECMLQDASFMRQPGVSFWMREKAHKLRARWQASFSSIRADVTVVLEVRQSIGSVLMMVS